MRQIATNYSSVASVHEIGLSNENRTILLLKVGTDNGNNVSKPAIFIESGVHADEVGIYHRQSCKMNDNFAGSSESLYELHYD